MIEPAAARKAAEAYRTIGEVAEELKLPQHVLRFWETRFPQIRPLKRAGGRRFYSSEDLALLRAIKARLYGEGYTIKGVQRLLQEHGVGAVAAETGPAPASRDGDAPPAGADLACREPPSAASPAQPIFAPEPPAAAAPRAAMTPALARLEALALDLQDCARLLAAARDPG